MTAVFYDVENLKNVGNYKIAVEEVAKVVVNSTRTLQYAYADWARLDNESRNVFVDSGINLKQVITGSNYYNSIKNAADIALSIDVMEVMFKNEKIENFILVSGDGGYISLVNKLKEYGKFVSVVSLDAQLSKALEKYVDKVYTIKEKDEIAIPSNQHIVVPECNNFLKDSSQRQENKQHYKPHRKAIWAILNEYKSGTVENFLDILFKNYSIIDKIQNGGFPYSDITFTNRTLGFYDETILLEKLDDFAKKHFFIKENKNDSNYSYIKGPESLKKVENAFNRLGIRVSMSGLREGLYRFIEAGEHPLPFNTLSKKELKKGVPEALQFIYNCLEKDLGSYGINNKINTDNYLDVISGPIAKYLNNPKLPISKTDMVEYLKYSKNDTKR